MILMGWSVTEMLVLYSVAYPSVRVPGGSQTQKIGDQGDRAVDRSGQEGVADHEHEREVVKEQVGTHQPGFAPVDTEHVLEDELEQQEGCHNQGQDISPPVPFEAVIEDCQINEWDRQGGEEQTDEILHSGQGEGTGEEETNQRQVDQVGDDDYRQVDCIFIEGFGHRRCWCGLDR